MKKNTGFLQRAFLKRGLTANEASRRGFGYDVGWKHWRGDRAVSAEKALEYEAKLGIPRSEPRPDLWAPLEAQKESA